MAQRFIPAAAAARKTGRFAAAAQITYEGTTNEKCVWAIRWIARRG
jgi:hypothetical protein